MLSINLKGSKATNWKNIKHFPLFFASVGDGTHDLLVLSSLPWLLLSKCSHLVSLTVVFYCNPCSISCSSPSCRKSRTRWTRPGTLSRSRCTHSCLERARSGEFFWNISSWSVSSIVRRPKKLQPKKKSFESCSSRRYRPSLDPKSKAISNDPVLKSLCQSDPVFVGFFRYNNFKCATILNEQTIINLQHLADFDCPKLGDSRD